MPESLYWIYGYHAVKSALLNPQRRIKQVWVTSDSYIQELDLHKIGCFKVVSKKNLGSILPDGAVHQGVACQLYPLVEQSLHDFILDHKTPYPLVLLDQVTDPHNVGAIIRSSAALGAKALLIPERQGVHPCNPVLTKVSSGGIEHVPVITIKNVARTLEFLKEKGYWIFGFDESHKPLKKNSLFGPSVLVFGSEGSGIRPLTRSHCDGVYALRTQDHFSTLNVSHAVSIVLYMMLNGE